MVKEDYHVQFFKSNHFILIILNVRFSKALKLLIHLPFLMFTIAIICFTSNAIYFGNSLDVCLCLTTAQVTDGSHL